MTDQELRDLVADNIRSISELRKTTEQNNKAVDRQLTKLGKEIGYIGNKFGRFTEGLFYPSLEKILTKDFGLEDITYRYKARRNGDNMELDMLGISSGSEDKAVIVEIKSQLRDADLNDFVKTLKLFPKFFPHYKTKKLFGVIAAVGISEEQKRRAENLGIYVVKISGETFKLVSKKDFKPKDFSEAEK